MLTADLATSACGVEFLRELPLDDLFQGVSGVYAPLR
jgi:hypothetical protein